MATIFTIDNIVHPDSRAAAEQLECPVCRCILEDPVQTRVCQHLFCKNCVERCKLCPVCRADLGPSPAGFVPLRECNQFALRMLHNLKVRCPHHGGAQLPSVSTSSVSAVGPLEAPWTGPAKAGREVGTDLEGTTEDHDGEVQARPGMDTVQNDESDLDREHELLERCEWTGSYSDLVASHLKTCPLHPVPCPTGCGKVIRRCELAAHESGCPALQDTCTICSKKVPPGTLAAHRREEAELHVQLLEARLQEEKESQSRMRGQITTLTRDLTTIKMVIKGMAKNAGDCPELVWPITNPQEVLASHRAGTTIRSENFFYHHMGPFQLLLYPNGRNQGATQCSIFLSAPKGLRVRFWVKIGDSEWRSRGPVDFDGTHNYGWGSFCRLAPDPEPVEIKVWIESAIGLLTSAP